MQFKNIQLNHMNEVEKLTENGFEIYENEVGAVFINHNPELDLWSFIGVYVDYHDYIILKPWNQFASCSQFGGKDYEVIKVLF